jgi:Tfp pilus assembly protein PilF
LNPGIALEGLGQLPQAVLQYNSAIAIDPLHADSHSNTGVALFQLGRADEAIHHYLLAVQLKPSHHDALNNLANAYQAGGRYDEAGFAYRRAIEIRPNHADLLSNYGNMLHASSQPEQAIAAWKHALGADPKHMNACYNLGSTLQAQQRLPEAEGAFKQLVEIVPQYAEGWAALGRILAMQRSGRRSSLSTHYNGLWPSMASMGRRWRKYRLCRRELVASHCREALWGREHTKTRKHTSSRPTAKPIAGHEISGGGWALARGAVKKQMRKRGDVHLPPPPPSPPPWFLSRFGVFRNRQTGNRYDPQKKHRGSSKQMQPPRPPPPLRPGFLRSVFYGVFWTFRN